MNDKVVLKVVPFCSFLFQCWINEMDTKTNVITARLRQALEEIHSIAANTSLEEIEHCMKIVISLHTCLQRGSEPNLWRELFHTS